MGLSLATFTTATALNAADLRTRLTSIEEYLNGGIVQADLTNTGWVKPFHIFKPEVRYPSWARLPTADVHWRFQPLSRQRRSVHSAHQVGQGWQPIRKAAATIIVNADNRPINILASMYVFQEEGDEYNGGAGANAPGSADESTLACEIALFVNDNEVSNTRRDVYMRGTDLHYRRAQHSWAVQTTLSTGVKDIAFKIRLNSTEFFPTDTSSLSFKRCVVDCRNLVIDCQYK